MKLRSQVAEKSKNNAKGRQRFTKACLIDNNDAVGLRKERESKKHPKERPEKARKGKMRASQASSSQCNDTDEWEQEEGPQSEVKEFQI
jgi:hypothetical protein